VSGFGVDPDEMPPSHPLDDSAVDAFIAGATDGIDALTPLATFADDLRVSASGPAPVPHGLLLKMVTEGFSTENVPTSIEPGPAPQVTGPPRRRTRMTLAQLLAGLAAKLAGLGMAAKAGLGLSLAAASVAGAGTAGVLPDPVQHAVASVVNAATPLQLPDPGGAASLVDDVTDDVIDDVIDVVDDVTTTTTTAVPGDDEGTGRATNHGACVSAIAKDKSAAIDGNHGKAVSEAAHSDCGKGDDDDGTATTTVPSTTTTTAGDTTTTTLGLTGATGGPGNGHGNGNGNGKGGNGNGGPGGSGPGNSGSNRP